MIRTSTIFAVMSCCFVLLIGASAEAGLLAVHPLAYNDGNGPAGGAWRGSSPFVNDGLSGTVDWAVFTASAFNSLPGLSGYTATAGELVYAHQIFTAGTLGATQMDIVLAGNPAGDGGSFTATGISGVSAFFAFADSVGATWLLDAETDTLTPSEGLVYSSPNRPQLTGIPTLLDGGVSAAGSLPIGIPGPNPIPEPAAWFLASIATTIWFLFRGGRRG
jgi:hypothetical protein